MHERITATTATVFLLDDFTGIDLVKLRLDYHEMYHSKRPGNGPEIRDKFFFIDGSDSTGNLEWIKAVTDLIKIHDLRAVNFIILEKGDVPLEEEYKTKFRDLMAEWDNHFKRNSFSGLLTLRVCTQNFQATLLDGKVRGINRFTLSMNSCLKT